MSIRDKDNSASKLAQKMQKKTKGLKVLKSSNINLVGFDLLPNIKLKKNQMIESDLFIKNLNLEKKKKKTKK